MFETFEPSSFAAMKDLLPNIGRVVTIEKCMYYLSLVEQISNLRDEFNEHLNTLHARAEMRYEYWIDGCKKAIPGPLVAPPIDVAYIMHAHLVSPFRYYEDCIRLNLPMLPMPFEQIHIQRNQPSEESLQFWALCAPPSEPYLLTVEEIVGDIILKTPCHHCGCTLSIAGSDYGYWRFHPTAFMACWGCKAETNMHHKAMVKLMSDIGDGRNQLRGTMMNSAGQLKQDWIGRDIQLIDAEAYFDGRHQGRQIITGQKNSVAEGLKGLPARFLDLCRNKERPTTNSMDELHQQYLHSSKTKTTKDDYALMRTIRWTYGDTNPSPFSLDLLQAVERQHVVGSRMLKVQWMFPDGVVRGLRNYKDFLLLMKNDRSLTGVPTLEIDVSWHTHQCHPVDYRNFTYKYIGRIINHDDTIPQYKLDIYSGHTRLAWQRKKDGNSRKKYLIPWQRKQKTIDFGLDYVHGTLTVEENVYSCHCQHHHHHHYPLEDKIETPTEEPLLLLQDQKTILLTKEPTTSKVPFTTHVI